MVFESAHRLIAVSLGKMASSRNQRGGVRLHRSLLVAGVLMNARTATSLCHTVDQQDTETPVSDNDDDVDELVESDEIEPNADSTMITSSAAGATHLSADEDMLLHDTDGLPTDVISAVESLTHQDDVYRLAGSVVTSIEYERKRKRPGADDEANDCIEVKRSRIVPETRAAVLTSLQLTVSDSSHDAADDNMETDTVQLSSLVHCFNSGFQGLLSNNSTVNNLSSLAYSLESVSDGRHHTSTSESIISCSVHIREALETLSRPVLAMPV